VPPSPVQTVHVALASETAAWVCVRRRSSSAVPTEPQLPARSLQTPHRGTEGQTPLCRRSPDRNEALTLSAGQQAPPATPPPAPAPQPPPAWELLKQHTSLLVLHKRFDPSHFAAQKRQQKTGLAQTRASGCCR